MTKAKSQRKHRPNGKLNHVRVSQVITTMRLSEIRPSDENNDIYGKFNPDHPDDRALIDDIGNRGIVEPLVVTLDGYILSGHRRHSAATYLGLEEVPVRVANVHHGDAGYHELLTAYNKQRVKSVDEVFREGLVDVDREEAHREIVEHRRRASAVDVETIAIVGHKHRCKIGPAKMEFLEAILAILRERRDFWPLTDRQVHYALLNDPPLMHSGKPHSRYANTRSAYSQTCELVTRARLEGRIPWGAIDDPTRPIVTWAVWREAGAFIKDRLDGFLRGYYRDYLQSQPNQIEIVGEKNTIDNIIRPVAAEFTIPMTIGRGYSSLSPRKQMADRFKASGKERLVILMLGDHDPEGNDICHSFARSMRDDFGIVKIEPIKVALTTTQIQEMQLPPVMKAKRTSSRYDKFVDQHGEDVFELEAVPPEQLQVILRAAIDSVLDLKMFNAEVDAEKSDVAKMESIRRRLQTTIGKVLLD